MTKILIHNGDNFKFVKNNTIDFVLTDPPFNISKKSNFHTYEKNTIHSHQFDGESDEAWDSYTHEEFLKMLHSWSAEWARVLKNGGNFAIFCADAYISHLMEALKANKLSPRRLFIWRKNNAVPVNRAYMPMSANEYIIVGVKNSKATFNADIELIEQNLDDKIIESTIVADKASTMIYSAVKEAVLGNSSSASTEEEHISEISKLVEETLRSSSDSILKKVKAMYKKDKEGKQYLQACVPNYIQNPIKVGNRIHPTEKPLALLQYLVALYSNKGDMVLDGFSGSGSTGEAAVTLGRDVTLIEREITFYNKMKNRLSLLSELEELS